MAKAKTHIEISSDLYEDWKSTCLRFNKWRGDNITPVKRIENLIVTTSQAMKSMMGE